MRTLLLLILVCLSFGSYEQTSITPLDCVDHFYHGVASGDPLSDRVIIWTRVTPDDFSLPVSVSYTMATDTGMMNIVSTGSMLTDGSKDFTVKFDVTGLTPDTYYYYEFSALGYYSTRGRTKTAPVGAVDSLRFGVVSCANLESGYFNAYEILTERNDIESVLMLGDYIYEYEEGGYSQDPNLDRIFDPTHEILTIDDYRLRYSVYHMDRSLQKLHQNFPWICVWDDHESANDSWMNGAENHNAGEGQWTDRKLAAQQAYFEWLPIRAKSPGNYEIFRQFEYGTLVDLFMVDTRLHGREEQGVNESDPNRTMMGTDQYTWLTAELDSTDAQWKVLGNQVMFVPITVFGIPINGDAWDGYPAERQNLMDHITDNNIVNFTVITGDIHTSWACNIDNNGYNAGVEFVTPSVTSPGAPINGGGILMLENSHIEYVELTKRGFVVLDVNQQRIQADWFYVNTISSLDNSYQWATSFYSNSGNMQLQETTSASLPAPKYNVDLAPQCPRISNVGLSEPELIGLIGVYPNPTNDNLNVYFTTVSELEHTITITDLNGRIVATDKVNANLGNSTIHVIETSGLESGYYILNISDDSGASISRKFQKL